MCGKVWHGTELTHPRPLNCMHCGACLGIQHHCASEVDERIGLQQDSDAWVPFVTRSRRSFAAHNFNFYRTFLTVAYPPSCPRGLCRGREACFG